jgi:hemolysin III
MSSDPIQPWLVRNPVSASTHLLFFVWAIFATALLRRLCGRDRLRRDSVTIFGLSVMFLYGASGVYHSISPRHPRLLDFFLRLDLSAIHVLIAGTCTPIFAVLLTGRLRLLLLGLLWTITTACVAARWLLPHFPATLTIRLYAITAAIGFLPAVPLLRTVGLRGMAWLVGGALAYLTGACCEALRWPTLLPGVVSHHEILHLCDMIGTAWHVIFIMNFVVRREEKSTTENIVERKKTSAPSRE